MMLSNYRSGPYPSREEIERCIPENLREGARGLDGWQRHPVSSLRQRKRDIRSCYLWRGPFVMVRDKRRWYNAYLWGESPLLYDLEADPKLKKNIAQEHPHICQRMKDLAVADAGGKVPESLGKLKGEPGCTPLLVE